MRSAGGAAEAVCAGLALSLRKVTVRTRKITTLASLDFIIFSSTRSYYLKGFRGQQTQLSKAMMELRTLSPEAGSHAVYQST